MSINFLVNKNSHEFIVAIPVRKPLIEKIFFVKSGAIMTECGS